MTGKAAEKRASTPSLHAQIIDEIEGRILTGEWAPGHRIPYEHELTDRFGCSRMTVNKALTQLARSGLIERRRKAGSFVTRPHGQSALLEIRDVAGEVAALGLPYAYAVLARRTRGATGADCKRLGVAAGAPVLSVACRHDAAGHPFCHENRLVSLQAVPEAAGETFTAVSPGPWLLARAAWTSAEHRIRATAADPKLAEIMHLDPGAPCLVIERRTWFAEQPVTHVTMTYAAEAHELVASFTPSRN